MKDTNKLLQTARERMRLCADAERDNRAQALEDLRFLNGEQWPAEAVKQRTLEGRPCMTFNQLPAIIQQVTNDQRQNTPSIKIHPVDDYADVETAEVLQGLIRHIEYESGADAAYDTAVNAAAVHGFGAWRLVAEYESPDSFDQVIRFKRIRDPLSVYIDPYAECPAGSDMRYCFVMSSVARDTFKLEYPKAKATDALAWEGVDKAIKSDWLQDDAVIVAEYYWIDQTPDTLLQMADGSTGWLSEMEEGAKEAAVRERKAMRQKVRWAKLTGVEVLEEAEIPGRWIPVFPVLGQEIDIDGKVHRWGIVRNARDPARMYNFWVTAATEEVSMRPRTHYIMAEGQDEGYEQEWQQANRVTLGYLKYKPKVVNGMLAPPPSRQPMADVPAGVLQMAMHARDNIKSTTGLYDASLGAQGNETSGRAILARQREGDTANFHFTDNLNRAIRHCGRVLVDMIPRIYDAERVVRVRGEDESIGSARINAEVIEDGVTRVLNDLTIGRYDVTVNAGPSYTTARQEAAEAMTQFAQSWPRLMDVAGDKVIRSMDWPNAEEIADRVEKTLPPGLAEPKEGEEGMPSPEQMQQQMQQMEQAMQQMGQELQEAKSGALQAQIDAEARIRVAEIEARSRVDVEELRGVTHMLAQRQQPPPELMRAAMESGEPSREPIQIETTQQQQTPPSAGFAVSGHRTEPPAGSEFAPLAGEGLPDDPSLTGQEIAE